MGQYDIKIEFCVKFYAFILISWVLTAKMEVPLLRVATVWQLQLLVFVEQLSENIIHFLIIWYNIYLILCH